MKEPKSLDPNDRLDPIGEKFLESLTDILYKYSSEQHQSIQTPRNGWTIYDTEYLLSELKVSLEGFVGMVESFEDVWSYYDPKEVKE